MCREERADDGDQHLVFHDGGRRWSLQFTHHYFVRLSKWIPVYGGNELAPAGFFAPSNRMF